MNNQDDQLLGLEELARKLIGAPARLGQTFTHFLRPPRKEFGRPPLTVLRAMTQWRTYSVALAAFLLWLGTAVLAEKLDPFGVLKAIDQYSQIIVDRIAAPLYGSPAQDRIAVVLIDEETLQARETAWPPRYTYYEEVIRRILKHRPRAIFMDILLEEQRVYDDSLPQAREALADNIAEAGIPVVFALSQPGRRTLFGDIPGVDTAIASWANTDGDYPLIVTPGTTWRDGGVKSGSTAPSAECDPERGTATVVTRLYHLACSRGPGCIEPSELLAGPALCKPMVVHWGRALAPVMTERELLPVASCDLAQAGLSHRLLAMVQSLLASAMAGIDEGAVENVRQPCPYTVTVKEHDLADPKVAGVLEDRIVLVGTHLDGLHDLVTSPVHGKLPGVYLHAMALDNLMTWGRDYYSRSDNVVSILIALALITALLMSLLLRIRPPRTELWLRLLALTIVLVPSLILYFVLRQPPLDWLGLLLLFEMIRQLMRQSVDTKAAPDTR